MFTKRYNSGIISSVINDKISDKTKGETMNDNLFSITDILQEAHDFFKIEVIETEIPTMRKHIERTLKNKNIDHTGKKRQQPNAITESVGTKTVSKRPVKAYTEAVKNDILNDYCKDYFLNKLRSDERKKVEKELRNHHGSKYYEEMSNNIEQENRQEMEELSNLYSNDPLSQAKRKLLEEEFRKQIEKEIQEFIKQKEKEFQDFVSSPYLLANAPDTTPLTKNSEIFRNKKREIMLDALFSEKFDLDEDKLLADCQILVETQEDYDAQFTPEGLEFTDKFANNKNYYTKIEEY
ncbi:hypothetical protein [Lactococcus petauri]|uniref:hypothetical protein n=2 Tax=Streptococcaceae TaxID=1300 RepID=UPI0028921F39|nr:hypothetical protein [Lactococcus petauri]MDT2561972.1 hypothetical protein [Lactococcus petauri]